MRANPEGPKWMPTARIFPAVVPILMTLAAIPLSGQGVPAYHARVKLPLTLFTAAGARIEKGGLDLEVRSDKEQQVLAFLNEGKVIATVSGQSQDITKPLEKVATVPLTGTIYLRAGKPSEAPAGENKEKAGSEGRLEFPLADHLGSRPWKASLRIYGFAQANSNEVHFVLKEETRPGDWSRTDFPLFIRAPGSK